MTIDYSKLDAAGRRGQPMSAPLELLTTSDVAAILEVPTERVREWCARAELPARRIGSRWCVSRKALTNWRLDRMEATLTRIERMIEEHAATAE